MHGVRHKAKNAVFVFLQYQPPERAQLCTIKSFFMTKATSPAILLTGATGNVGSQLVRELTSGKTGFKALVRPSAATRTLSSLPGVEIIEGDLSDAQCVEQALQGVERAFLLTSSSEQAEQLQLGFVKAAARAGVRHIVKLSQYAASAGSPVRFLRYHAAVEQAIKDSGMAYTFLRPNLYMQGLLAFREYIARQGRFYAAIGNARVSAIDVRDIAAVAAAALTKPGHENKIYDLTGPEALTHGQMAAHLSDALGKQVAFVDISPGEMEKALVAAGFPGWQVGGLIEDYAHYARGEAAEVSTAVQELTGAPARSFGSFAKDYAAFFS